MEGIKGVGRSPIEQDVFNNVQASQADSSTAISKEKNAVHPDNFENQDLKKKVSEEIDLFKENFDKLKKIFRGEAEFKIDRDTNMIVIKIKDPETGEIIRQIPPELALKMAKNIQELLGVLIDERV